jgi:hypothetical protein
MVLKEFQNHNDKVENLVGKDFAPGTAERYNSYYLVVYYQKLT